MNLLIDTNIFIPLEPTSMQEAAAGSASVAILLQTAQTVNVGIFIHPEIVEDIQRDADLERRGLHMRAVAKYRQLPAPPHVTNLPSTCVPASVHAIRASLFRYNRASLSDYGLSSKRGDNYFHLSPAAIQSGRRTYATQRPPFFGRVTIYSFTGRGKTRQLLLSAPLKA